MLASLVDAHTALVEAYRAAALVGWESGPDDGYFFQHLPQHLSGADRQDEVKALLCNFDWLVAKLRAQAKIERLDKPAQPPAPPAEKK